MLSLKGSFSGHEKIEEILRRLTHFSHQMNVLVFLVAHPFKMKKDEKTGIYEVPDFYSVKGSSAFFEMCYHGAVIYRTAFNVMVKVLKVKQNNLGTAGESAYFLYERLSGRYVPCDEEGNEMQGTHRETDWLEQGLELEKNNYNKKQ
jgi:twinkle protein